MGGFNQHPFNSQPFNGPGGNIPPPPTPTGIPFGPGPGTICYQALRHAGQILPGAIPAPEMVDDALFECNSMIDSWGAQGLDQYFIDDRYFNINVSQQSYTVGPTGIFNTDANNVALTYRPQRIIRANLVLLSNNSTQPVRIPIQIIPVRDYAEIPLINIATQVVIQMYVQTTKDNVTIWCFPYPTVGNQFEFFMWPGFPQFQTVASLFDAPPGWQDFMTYELAKRMYTLTTKDVGRARQERLRILNRMAVLAKQVVEASNAPTLKLDPDIAFEDAGGQGAPFNYLYGSYSQ